MDILFLHSEIVRALMILKVSTFLCRRSVCTYLTLSSLTLQSVLLNCLTHMRNYILFRMELANNQLAAENAQMAKRLRLDPAAIDKLS